MLDRSIPFYNLILRCDHYEPQDIKLPAGFSIASYQPGDELAWARLEHGIGDFDTPRDAEEYFIATYLRDRDQYDRILFLRNPEGEVVGSSIAWQDRRGDAMVSSLHWLVVDERYRGLGLGRALTCATMNFFARRGALPVYIHTQPWSWKAILLYLTVGFCVQRSDTFASYENQYDEAMATLEGVVTDAQFSFIKASSEN